MKEIFYIVHVLVSMGLIGLVLLQHGKGADAGAAFGSGASATVFGSQGSASFLSRTTAVLATVFFLTSLFLAYLSAQNKAPESVLENSVTTQIVEEEERVPADMPPVPAPGEIQVPPPADDAPMEATPAVEPAAAPEPIPPAAEDLPPVQPEAAVPARTETPAAMPSPVETPAPVAGEATPPVEEPR